MPSAKTITVNFASAVGTAKDVSDYNATNGTLTFAPGQTSQVINVPIKGDTSMESDETFFVLLSGATNAHISTGRATGTITNDDTATGRELSEQ